MFLPDGFTAAQLNAALSGYTAVVMPEGVCTVDYPVRIPIGRSLTGAGRANTKLKQSYRSGPVVACVPETIASAGDADGFIVGNQSKAQILLHRSRQFCYPLPADGAIRRRFKFKWQSGAGSLWMLGGDLTSRTRPIWQGGLFCDGTQFTLYANFNPDVPYYGWRAGVSSGPVDCSQWRDIGIEIRPDGGALTVDGVAHAMNGVVFPPQQRWFDKEIVGWFDGGNIQGRIKDFATDTLYGTVTAPLTNSTDGLFFPINGADAGFLMAEPMADIFPYTGVRLSDFSLESGSGDGIGLYVTNLQGATFERLETHINNLRGAIFHKDCYRYTIRDCEWGAAHTSLMLDGNAGQANISGCTFHTPGGKCGVWIENCYGVTLDGKWVIGTDGGVPIVIAGGGGMSSVLMQGLLCYDDQGALRDMPAALFRDSKVDCVGVTFKHQIKDNGPVVWIDGGGAYRFFGGELAGRLSRDLGGESPVPIFKVIRPPLSPVAVRDVDRGQGYDPSPTPWCSDEDAQYFDISGAGYVPARRFK